MTCKIRRPYNLYCVGGDIKPCTINRQAALRTDLRCDLADEYSHDPHTCTPQSPQLMWRSTAGGLALRVPYTLGTAAHRHGRQHDPADKTSGSRARPLMGCTWTKNNKETLSHPYDDRQLPYFAQWKVGNCCCEGEIVLCKPCQISRLVCKPPRLSNTGSGTPVYNSPQKLYGQTLN